MDNDMPRITLRAITPKRAKILDPKIVRREIEKEGIDDAKRQLLNMAEMTVRTWHTKPKFRTRMIATANEIGVDITPSKDKPGQQWEWISEGTKPRLIVPRRKGGMLRFQSKFKPKTTPRVIGSKAGARGGKPVFAKSVRHPGIEAREWPQEMARRLKNRFKQRIENALRRAARASQT